MSSPRPVRLVAYAAALALAAATLAAPTATAAPEPAPRPTSKQASATTEVQRALAALDAVRELAQAPSGAQQRSPGATTQGPRGDLTMALRELANTRDALSGADREAADALLKRPPSAGGDGLLSYGGATEAAPVCDDAVCVHYVTTGRHAPKPTDTAPANGVPDFVDTAAATLDDVHDWFVDAGYREPKADGALGGQVGGNSRIDVYLGDIGQDGLYGYCTSDDPSVSTKRWDRWAYCVLDEDYAEFPSNTPVENLQVTAAHEYFHAVQYAYDRFEDGWLLESTAAWVEDELYDDVDDNLQYLASSQLKRPKTPLDTFNPMTGFHYGTWTFWRYLTEKYRQKQGLLPRLVLDVWNKVDGAPGGPDLHSWAAVDAVLRTKKSTGAAALGGYAVANRHPAAAYEEGKANQWRKAPVIGTVRVTRRNGAKATVTTDHLTTATGRLVPQALPAGWRLKVRIDMSPKVTGSVALVTTTLKNNTYKTVTVRLDRQGDGTRTVPFSSATVKHVEVTLVNGSGRFACFTSQAVPSYSCSGTPKDDDRVQRFTARAVR